MSRSLTFYKGDTIERTLYFFTRNTSDPKLKKPYQIPSGSVIELKFPGGVSISSADSEVSFTANDVKATYTISAVKSANLSTSNSRQDITVIVYEGGAGLLPKTFVDEDVLYVKSRPNT